MKQGKRNILYTLLAVCVVTVLVAAATRLYATAIDENTPPWQRSLMALGLAVAVKDEPVPESAIRSVIEGNSRIVDLSQFSELKGLAVEGDISVEAVSAPQYRLILTPAAGVTLSMATEKKEGGQLRIRVGGMDGIALRIEAPVLKSIEAHNLRQLTIRGWQAPDLTLRMKNVTDVHLQEVTVWRWILHAETPVAMRVDKATLSAGLNLQYKGQISISGVGKQKANFRGSGAISIRNSE